MGERNGLVTVVGSCNTDLISYVKRRPERGETVLGKKFQIGFGGKGANQAVAASRLGVKTCMVAKVGHDTFGTETIQNFRNNDVDIEYMFTTDEAATGAAPITVEETGENSIIVNSGANDLLSSKDVMSSAPAIKSSSVLLCQGEVPLETTLSALKLANKHNVITVLNPAPASPAFTKEFYRFVDIVCPNETECEILCGIKVTDASGDIDMTALSAALDWFLAAGCDTALVTLGKHGAAYKCKEGGEAPQHVTPLYPVSDVVDTTGAGDAFLGSLAFYLAAFGTQITFTDTVQRANYIAGLSVQKPGTQTSFPARKDLPQKLFGLDTFK